MCEYLTHAFFIITTIACSTYYWYGRNKLEKKNNNITELLHNSFDNAFLGVVNGHLLNKIPTNGIVYSEKDGINYFNSKCGIAKTNCIVRVGDIVMMERFSGHTAIAPTGRSIYNF